MLINAPNSKNRTSVLIEKYSELLKNGVKAQNILVLVQNSNKKNYFIEQIKKNSPLGSIGEIKVYSFFGLCYNFISQNWAIIENSIKDNNSIILPNLVGLEVSQKLFKDCINEVDFTGYNSKISLLHQMLRRYSLITLNDLSQEEMDSRSKILQESFSSEANLAINKYKKKTLDYRAFDYIRQMNLFEYLYKKIKNPFEYVFLDDGDEITPIELSYLEYIKPDIKEFFIAYDSLGSSRLGYLGAINVDFEKFLGEKALQLKADSAKIKRAKDIAKSIREDKLIERSDITFKSSLRRDEMIKEISKDIKELIKKGIKPSDIVIVTPLSDDGLKSELLKPQNLAGFDFNFLTKSEKLNQNKAISYILEFLKIVNSNKKEISPYTLKGILIELFGVDGATSLKLIQEYKLKADFDNQNIFEFLFSKNEFKELYEFYIKIKDEPLSFQLYQTASRFIELNEENSKNIIKINQLLKQVVDYENVFDDVDKNSIIIQLQNTIISENPLSDDEIDSDSIIVSTAQKIIDYSIKSKYQFLIDASNENWLRQDIGPLYNAWVISKKWSKESYELSDNIELSKDKNARILYKLSSLADNITIYSSVYDSLGQENISGIDKYFKFENKIDKKEKRKIIPRKDQEAVLDYKGGLMSVSATAGSGKTTIMLLLVEKLLSGVILKDIEAKNIFVLTFMESAARNFRERIKNSYPDMVELPSISTIHGLALRIIKENNNYSKLNLDYDFEIVDEIKRNSIIEEILNSYNMKDKKTLAMYDRAISTYKIEITQNKNYISSNKLFMNVFSAYQNKLKEESLIDYDDLLSLCVKLLRENSDILNYYQDLARVVIEDEAQDSSALQQELIKLISGKHKNVIRCGDINQAITTTFTNSDTQGFRDFIKKSNNVVMDRCQRCATGVLDCANNTVKISKKDKIDAFSSLVMKPVDGVNIVDKNAVSSFIFEEEKNEESFIVNKIKDIFKDEPNVSIAVLLRSNFAIDKWDNILKKNSIKTYRASDSLSNNPVFWVVMMIFKYISDPYNIALIKEIANYLYEKGYYSYETYKYVAKLKEPIFLTLDYDEPLYWDMNYFLFKNHSSLYDLALDIAQNYFSNTKEEANISLVASIVAKIQTQTKSFEEVVEHLEKAGAKPNFSNIKLFNVEDKSIKQNKIQIMTLHKSKGDEFDYVFIPELTDENLPLNLDTIKIKENSKFIQKVKAHPKDENELKKEAIEENYRLIYVGITRAKKKLYLTSAKKYKFYNGLRDFKLSSILEDLGAKCEK